MDMTATCIYDTKTEEGWLRTADEFNHRTNFPNCTGAADSKHIRMC
jgi:hypothetical protein